VLRIMSAAVMPQAGTYEATKVSRDEWIDFVRHAVDWGTRGVDWESYIGYESTVEYLRELGVAVPMNRVKTVLEHGDTLAVVRLKYRVRDPKAKGRFEPMPDDYEFLLVDYMRPGAVGQLAHYAPFDVVVQATSAVPPDHFDGLEIGVKADGFDVTMVRVDESVECLMCNRETMWRDIDSHAALCSAVCAVEFYKAYKEMSRG